MEYQGLFERLSCREEGCSIFGFSLRSQEYEALYLPNSTRTNKIYMTHTYPIPGKCDIYRVTQDVAHPLVPLLASGPPSVDQESRYKSLTRTGRLFLANQTVRVENTKWFITIASRRLRLWMIQPLWSRGLVSEGATKNNKESTAY